MDESIRTKHLANGLIVEFLDCSNRYYGDYHRVRIEVRCRLPLAEKHFSAAADPAAELERARRVLGREVSFARSLEQMGVPGAAVETTRQSLIDSFVSSTFPYLEREDFPARLVARELAAVKKFGKR